MNEVRLDATGPASPPMANGELVFAEPWEGRVFGMAHALADAGVFTWDEFRAALIAAIHESEHEAQGPYRYYVCFSAALEALLAARGVCDAATLSAHAGKLAAREPGHDHHNHHQHAHQHAHEHR